VVPSSERGVGLVLTRRREATKGLRLKICFVSSRLRVIHQSRRSHCAWRGSIALKNTGKLPVPLLCCRAWMVQIHLHSSVPISAISGSFFRERSRTRSHTKPRSHEGLATQDLLRVFAPSRDPPKSKKPLCLARIHRVEEHGQAARAPLVLRARMVQIHLHSSVSISAIRGSLFRERSRTRSHTKPRSHEGLATQDLLRVFAPSRDPPKSKKPLCLARIHRVEEHGQAARAPLVLPRMDGANPSAFICANQRNPWFPLAGEESDSSLPCPMPQAGSPRSMTGKDTRPPIKVPSFRRLLFPGSGSSAA